MTDPMLRSLFSPTFVHIVVGPGKKDFAIHQNLYVKYLDFSTPHSTAHSAKLQAALSNFMTKLRIHSNSYTNGATRRTILNSMMARVSCAGQTKSCAYGCLAIGTIFQVHHLGTIPVYLFTTYTIQEQTGVSTHYLSTHKPDMSYHKVVVQ